MWGSAGTRLFSRSIFSENAWKGTEFMLQISTPARNNIYQEDSEPRNLQLSTSA